MLLASLIEMFYEAVQGIVGFAAKHDDVLNNVNHR